MSDIYGVKVVYRRRAGEEVFYEEQILRVEAEDFDQAYERAKACVETYCEEHVNPFGQRVWVEGFHLLDCYLADEEEIYSRIFQNPFGDDEEKLLTLLERHSSVEEMYSLRNAEFNRPSE